MPGPLAPLVGFVLGVAFAWAASDELSRGRGTMGSRPLIVTALFSGLLFAPAAAYFLVFDTDWSFAYLIDGRHLPSAVELALALVDAASGPVGFWLAAPKARAHQLVPLLLLVLVPTTLIIAFVGLLAPRLAIEATYAQFHGDFGTRSVAGSSLGHALLWMNGVLVAGVAFTVRDLREPARRPRTGRPPLGVGGSASPRRPRRLGAQPH